MKWSFKIGSIFGIPVRIHITFLLLLFFVAVNPHKGLLGGLVGVVFIILVFIGVLLHELGHSLVARHFGESVHDIVLLPIGGVSRMEIPQDPRQEILVAVSGPVVSLILAMFFLILSLLFGYSLGFGSFIKAESRILVELFYVNLMLAIFNLIPAFPMDGGRILRGILALRMEPVRATRIAVGVGQVLAVVMFFIGIFFNWWLALIAIFLYFGAETEEQGTILRQVFHRVPVRALMLEDFQSLKPEDTLSQVLEIICHSAQEDFPVLDDGRLVGVLPKSIIFRALREMPPETRVEEIMVKDFFQAEPDMPLDRALKELAENKAGVVPVVEAGKLVGILTLDQIAKYQLVCGAKPQERLAWIFSRQK